MEYIYTFVLLSSWITISGAQTCNDAAINNCWAPMNSLPEHLTWSSIVPTLAEQQMRQHCQIFDQVEVCLKNILSSCPLLDNKAQQGVIDAYKWVCDDAFDEYLKHRQCFTNTALHNEGSHCNSSLITRLDNLDSSQPADYRLERICQYANDYLDCVENAVKSFCGSEAATWQRVLDTKNLEPILSLAKCQLDKSGRVYYQSVDNTKTYIIIGVIVALTVVLILLSVVMLILFKRKKSRLAEHRRANIDAHHNVGFSTNGNIATAYIQPGINQAGPLPKKMDQPELPPPYEPYLAQPHLNEDAYTSLNLQGAVATSAPPYEEHIQKVAPGEDSNNTDYSHSNGTSSHQTIGLDNPVYNDFQNVNNE